MTDLPSYNESWWERELHRNEKLMDRYLAALADNPDLATRHSDDTTESHALDSENRAEEPSSDQTDALTMEQLDELYLETGAALEDMVEDAEHPDDNQGGGNVPPDNAGYEEIALAARRFAVAIGSLDPCSEIPDILFLSAPKVGANLAGGHGLGYDEETLCGNIVKCRWALADCEFCREMLEHLVQRTGREVYRKLAAQSLQLSNQIRERVTRLRSRVWW